MSSRYSLMKFFKEYRKAILMSPTLKKKKKINYKVYQKKKNSQTRKVYQKFRTETQEFCNSTNIFK